MLSYGMAFASDLERLREVIVRVNQSMLAGLRTSLLFVGHRSILIAAL